MSIPIESYRVRQDPRHLTVRYTIGVPECYGTIGEPQVSESESAVMITLTRIPPKQTGEIACIDIALTKKVEVWLDQPLGDRKVVDGSLDEPVAPPPPIR